LRPACLAVDEQRSGWALSLSIDCAGERCLDKYETMRAARHWECFLAKIVTMLYVECVSMDVVLVPVLVLCCALVCFGEGCLREVVLIKVVCVRMAQSRWSESSGLS